MTRPNRADNHPNGNPFTNGKRTKGNRMTRQANIKWAEVLTAKQTAAALARRLQHDRDERRSWITDVCAAPAPTETR